MAEDFGIDLAAARGFLAAKDEARERILNARFAKAGADFQAIASLIIERYRPKRLYQWGSLLDRRRFSEISDIDIALEGIQNAETYFAILGEVMNMTEFPLDIVEMEKIGAENARHIRETGRLVHERP
jgi:predicted nucleotidyltransferase